MLLSCSLEEAALGYCKEIIITMHKDNSITIEDNGRGIYVYDETSNASCWKERFCEFFSEIKSDTANSKETSIGWMCSNTKEKINSLIPYEIHSSSLKLFAPQYASEFMNVRICRDGRLYTLHFEKGENIGGLR